MELLGIVLSVPVALVCCMLYCLLLAKIISRFQRLGRALRFLSLCVLATFIAEITLLITLGSVRSRGLLGPGFYVTHVILFFLGPPALANVLILEDGTKAYSKWYVAGVLCAAFAFFLVLLQYTVSESLY